MAHGVWVSEEDEVVTTLFFIIRISLILSFVNRMKHFRSLPQDVKRSINDQVKQVVVYYLGCFINLIDKEEMGPNFAGPTHFGNKRENCKGIWNEITENKIKIKTEEI